MNALLQATAKVGPRHRKSFPFHLGYLLTTSSWPILHYVVE